MIEATAAVLASVEGKFTAGCGEDGVGIPEVTCSEEAGGSSETVPEEVAFEWVVGVTCERSTASAIDSSESDVRSTVEGILEGFVGKQRSRKWNRNLLALEAMRSI